ncbi:hypothetical protein PV328_006023 [Microctonus aethiopoides]|uniref:Tudor domain-containing protein n=1 Tax=Microctonus aethiopoides TaxID=144406 RepID=A0AA39FP08_9HYME|nr:hypothetical protein PV328_006023 [Microctonus aethiopoides]
MGWAAKQITLPLLIGVSLTSVCVGLYYFLFKKEDKNERKTLILKDKENHVIELKVSKQHVPAVIGRGGSTIKDIEEKTSTRIRFNNDDITTSERICIIKGTFECTKLAEAMVKSIIENQPIIETYEMFIPQRVRSALLADRGEIIHAIQASTHAKLILEKGYSDNPDDKKRIIIKGSAEQIAGALYHIEDMVREFNNTREKLEVGQSTRSPRGKIFPRNNTPIANKTELQVQSEESLITHEGTMEVYVSAVHNPNQFWVQVVGPGILALDELVANMTTYYNNEENRELHSLKNVAIGQVVAAKFSFDNRWYRAEVNSFVGNGQYEVFFVDYGDHDVMNLTDILELRTDFLSARLQAIECSLANVKPKNDEWSQEVSDRFSDLCWCAQWKIIIAKVRGYKERSVGQGKCRREGSPIPCVDLFDKNDNQDINIGMQLVIENLAVADEGTCSSASSTLSLSKNSIDNTSSPLSSPTSAPAPVAPKDLIPPDITTSLKTPERIVEEIDLTTPKKVTNSVIEEIDLVTPKHNYTREFIEGEIKMNIHENGSGDHGQNENEFPTSTQWRKSSNIMPAGDESDHDKSDEFEIG